MRAILTRLGLGPDHTSSRTSNLYVTLVLAGLLLFAVVSVLETLRAHKASPKSSVDERRWGPAALIAIGMVLDVALMEWAGFVLASTALFWLTARAFDRQHPGRDALFAFGLSAAAYLLFVRVLNVTLPAGFIARWL